MTRTGLSFRQVMLAAGAVIVFLLLADFNNRWNDRQRLTLQYEQAVSDQADLEATATVLQAAIDYASSDAAVEAWAYEEGGMVRPGDNLIVPLPAPGGPPAATPTSAPTQEPQQNWDVWWSLFFDPETPEP